MKSVNQGLKGQ